MLQNQGCSDQIAHSVDDAVLERLAVAVLEARKALGKSQHEFAALLNVAQSTIASWEKGERTPNLENMEKLARIRGQLPEEFVAYLYGRKVGEPLPIAQRIKLSTPKEKAAVLRAIADGL